MRLINVSLVFLSFLYLIEFPQKGIIMPDFFNGLNVVLRDL